MNLKGLDNVVKILIYERLPPFQQVKIKSRVQVYA